MTRCRAMTYAGQPGHFLVRCIREEGHLRSHIPGWDDKDRNDPPTKEETNEQEAEEGRA